MRTRSGFRPAGHAYAHSARALAVSVGGASSIGNYLGKFTYLSLQEVPETPSKERPQILNRRLTTLSIVMSTSDSPNKRAILALKGEEGNDVCADCGRKGENF